MQDKTTPVINSATQRAVVQHIASSTRKWPTMVVDEVVLTRTFRLFLSFDAVGHSDPIHSLTGGQHRMQLSQCLAPGPQAPGPGLLHAPCGMPRACRAPHCRALRSPQMEAHFKHERAWLVAQLEREKQDAVRVCSACVSIVTSCACVYGGACAPASGRVCARACVCVCMLLYVACCTLRVRCCPVACSMPCCQAAACCLLHVACSMLSGCM